MKTLDEVIKGMEHCHEGMCIECPYQFEPMDFDCITQCQYTDALHYLKEYQTLQYGYVKAMADLEDNPPLTWDELKGMKGKPVWVETKYYSSRWAVITDVDDVRIRFVGKQLLDSEIVQEMGKTWQAYRKERINNVSRNKD